MSLGSCRALLLLVATVSIVLGGRSAMAEVQPWQIEGPSGPLGGAWQPADGKAKAAAVIIPGSGPTDRDGNSPHGVKAATLRLLAEGLSARGVASVRIDKRGMFASGGAAADANAVRFVDYTDDAVAWAREASKRAGLSCAWIIGHSEGGLVAMLAAARSGGAACGTVLLAAAGRRISIILREQLAANPANKAVWSEIESILAAQERGERVAPDAMHPALCTSFPPVLQGYLIDWMALDPADVARRSSKPMLILQGTHDLQVTLADARRLGAARPDARLVELPGVNHVLKPAPADRAGNLATYDDASLPLAAGVVEAVVQTMLRP